MKSNNSPDSEDIAGAAPPPPSSNLPGSSREAPGPVLRDASISLERANVLALLILPFTVVLCLGPFWAMWGWTALADGASTVFVSWIFLPAFLLAIVVHEALHALGFLLAGAPPRALHFGIDRNTLSPFAGCRVPVTVEAYRVAVLLPGLVLGVLPWVYGIVTGAGWAVIWAAVMIVTAAGDAIVLWILRMVTRGARVLDHPTRAGCHIAEDGAVRDAGAESSFPAPGH